jgi:tetratricopeptide (TPR) repeat protein
MQQPSDPTADGRLRLWLQRHERGAIAIWLGGCALLVAFLAAWGLWANGAERVVDALDGAWVRELDALAAEVRARRFEEALPALERLDRRCPAVFVKHRFDRERERLLGLLARCYVELDRRRLARETLQRLVAFDPRNFDNHFQLAEAERAFGDDAASAEAYRQVLAIHPTHLPSVQAAIELAFAAGDHAAVIGAYERYLDAWLLGEVRLRFDDRVVELEALVDGRERVLEGAVVLPAGWSGGVCVETGGYSARIAEIELVAPPLAGLALPAESSIVRPAGDWVAAGGAGAAPGELAATASDSRLCGPAAAPPQGAARVRVRLALFKALPAELWSTVARSYRNQIAGEALERAGERSRVGGCLAAGSSFAES